MKILRAALVTWSASLSAAVSRGSRGAGGVGCAAASIRTARQRQGRTGCPSSFAVCHWPGWCVGREGL